MTATVTLNLGDDTDLIAEARALAMRIQERGEHYGRVATAMLEAFGFDGAPSAADPPPVAAPQTVFAVVDAVPPAPKATAAKSKPATGKGSRPRYDEDARAEIAAYAREHTPTAAARYFGCGVGTAYKCLAEFTEA